MSQNPCSEDASESNTSPSQKTQRVLGGLTGRFVGRFCGGFLGLAGGFRGGRAPADFLFSAGGYSGRFWRIFFCICDQKNLPQKSTAKSTASMAVFWQIFHRGLNPRPTVSKFQVQHWNPEIGTRFVCPSFFAASKKFLEHGNRSGNPQDRQVLTDRTGQEIAHSKARRWVEIYTSKTRIAPPN